MIRLMGILTGSAIAVGILIVGLGMPEFSGTIPEPAQPAEPAEPVTASEAVTNTEAGPSADVAKQAETQAETQAEIQTEIQPPTDDANNTVETLPLETLDSFIDSEAVPPAEPTPPIEQPPTMSEANWYAFWSPFRSEIAADGFVAQLQRTTGLDYRVVKLKPGVYEVAFAYLDENDIQDKLARISTATGLDLSGG